MIRRLAILFLILAVGFALFLNITLYLGLGGESTSAVSELRRVPADLLAESVRMARNADEQISFVKGKLSNAPALPHRPQLSARDPFGIVTKTEKEEVPFTFKLSGIVGDEENGFIAVMSDGKQTVFVKEGDAIGQSPFILKKISPSSAEISGPKNIRLTLGGGK